MINTAVISYMSPILYTSLYRIAAYKGACTYIWVQNVSLIKVHALKRETFWIFWLQTLVSVKFEKDALIYAVKLNITPK
jgi:hypothetical protein